MKFINISLPIPAMKVNVRDVLKYFILLHEKFRQFDWLRAVAFELTLKYLHAKITNLLRVVE